MSEPPRTVISLNLERALRWAAVRHHGQTRKGSDVPYVEHLVGVALILDRLRFDEDTVIAGLLHDVVEDTAATAEEVEAMFGPVVGEIVRHCSERKHDASGRKRPWLDRKREHLAAFAEAPPNARAVLLADKLHNLLSIELDLREGRAVWASFNADLAQVLWYYRASIETLAVGERRLEELGAHCRAVLETIDALESPK
jgi:(p)ppGpp synthase/HD superfamily hydrolase